MSFEKGPERKSKKRSDLTLAGAVALAISSGADAKAEEHVTHIETEPYTITEVEQAHDLDQAEQTQYDEAMRLISEHPNDTKKIARSLLGQGEEKGIFYRVSPDVVAAVNLNLLNRGDHVSSELAPLIVFFSDTYFASEKADEVLIKAAEISGRWNLIGDKMNSLVEQNPPWLRDLLEKTAERVDVNTFFDDVLKAGSDGFFGQSKAVQGWLGPIVEKNYSLDPTALVDGWVEIEESYNRSEAIKEQISHFNSSDQIIQLLQILFESEEDYPEIKLDAALHLVSNFEWWTNHPDAEVYLEKAAKLIAKNRPYSAFENDKFVQAVSGKDWEIEYYEIALEQPARHSLYFSNYDVVSSVLPQHEFFSKYATSTLVLEPLIENFVHFSDNPDAIKFAVDNFHEVDPVLGLDFIKWADSNLPQDVVDQLMSSIPNAMLEIALLAKNLSPDYMELRNDDALSQASLIDRRLVFPLLSNELMDKAEWEKLAEHISQQSVPLVYYPGSREDSEKQIALLKEHSSQFNNVDPIVLENSVAIVARNLHTQGLPFTEENVRTEVERIAEMRERIGSQDLFSGDVTLASHSEIFESATGIHKPGEVRFGTEALVDSLRARVDAHGFGNSFSHFGEMENGGITPEMIATARDETVATITNNLNALTIVFDGHGGKDAFYFSDGQINEDGGDGEVVETDTTVKISAEDFASALIERYRKQIEAGVLAEGESNISLVFSACYMNDLINAISEKLEESETPLPRLMISAAERGQTGYSDFDDTFGSTTNRWIGESGDIRELIEREGELDSNPSIFVPDPSDPSKPMQISGVIIPSSNSVA